MIPKRELVLMLVDSIPKHEKATYTKLHKLVYLVNNQLKEKYKQDAGYEFNTFMSHAGPYDEELQDDLDTWVTFGLIHNNDPPTTHDLKATDFGKSDFKDNGVDKLKKALGSKQNFEEVKTMIMEYASKPEHELIKDAVKEWSNHHTDQINKIKTFFPFVKEGS